jgi:DNA-binding phage protein
MSPAAKPRRKTLSDQLRDSIAAYDSPNAAAQAAVVDSANLYRFTNGERSITLDTVDRLAEALGLRLVETGPARSPGRSVRNVKRKADTV